MSYLPCRYLYISFVYCTCWVPTISLLNLAIFPCYSNLLFRRRRWTEILWWGVLGYVLPRLPFLWCYGVFRYSISLRVILVFKDIFYVIIILYICDIWLSVSTFGRMCGTIDPRSCIRWVLAFVIKLGMTPVQKLHIWKTLPANFAFCWSLVRPVSTYGSVVTDFWSQVKVLNWFGIGWCRNEFSGLRA
jgi:hypothetical protein